MTSWEHEGDMAEAVVRQLHNQHLAKINADGESFVDQAPVMTMTGKSFFDLPTFRWRADEKDHLDRIRAAVDVVMSNLFQDARQAVDEFYGQLRVPEQDTNTGLVIKDSSGRMVWQTDERGNVIERWSQMTGQDIEQCLLDLGRVKLEVSTKVHELLMEALFAKHLYDDQYQDAYAELVEDTIPGRQAYASRKTRIDKYHSYFRYYLWSTANTFLGEVNNFCRVLERVGYWRSLDYKNTSRGQ